MVGEGVVGVPVLLGKLVVGGIELPPGPMEINRGSTLGAATTVAMKLVKLRATGMKETVMLF